jgi:hypothetical protein
MVTVKPTLAYAAGLASPIATRDVGGGQEVSIVIISANNGFIRGDRSQLVVYPRGSNSEEHGADNATLMDSTGTRDTHPRAISTRRVVNVNVEGRPNNIVGTRSNGESAGIW